MDVGTVGMLVLLSLILLIPSATAATQNNDQTPNRQITTTNTRNDNGWWERFSIRTNTTFSIANKAFTFQLNTFTNGCGKGGNCIWWTQAITGIDAGSVVGKTGGYWLHDAHLEPFYGTSGGTGDLGSYCKLTIPKLVNIDNYDYNVQIQVTNSSSGVTFQLTVTDVANSTNFYSISKTCAISANYPGPIDYAYQVEGAIAGCGTGNLDCVTNVSFSPLKGNIFGAYIDLVSNYNVMSSSSLPTQTGEGSNLYQIVSDYYGTTYGSKYVYTVVSSSFYYSSGGEVTYPFYLTMQHSAGGTVSPASGYYSGGGMVNISATGTCGEGISKGTIFTGWTGQGAGSYTGYNNPATVTMNSNITETATFSLRTICPQIIVG